MITGVHALLYTSQAAEVRAFFRDVLGLSNVDNGDGWLIFKLPPAELGVHPGQTGSHELYLLCDDIEATMAELSAKGVTFAGPAQDRGFGIVATIQLPGDLTLDLYQPKHELAIDLP